MEDLNMVLQNEKIINTKYSVFNTILFNNLLLKLTKQGEKAQSLKIVKKVSTQIKQTQDYIKKPNSFLKELKSAYNKIKPVLRLKLQKNGKNILQKPSTISFKKQNNIALMWLLLATQKHADHTFAIKLFKEIKNANSNTGSALELKNKLYQTALSNKRFLYIKRINKQK